MPLGRRLHGAAGLPKRDKLGGEGGRGAIGQFYVDFRQVGDDEVCDLLDRIAPGRGEQAGSAPP